MFTILKVVVIIQLLADFSSKKLESVISIKECIWVSATERNNLVRMLTVDPF